MRACVLTHPTRLLMPECVRCCNYRTRAGSCFSHKNSFKVLVGEMRTVKEMHLKVSFCGTAFSGMWSREHWVSLFTLVIQYRFS